MLQTQQWRKRHGTALALFSPACWAYGRAHSAHGASHGVPVAPARSLTTSLLQEVGAGLLLALLQEGGSRHRQSSATDFSRGLGQVPSSLVLSSPHPAAPPASRFHPAASQELCLEKLKLRMVLLEPVVMRLLRGGSMFLQHRGDMVLTWLGDELSYSTIASGLSSGPLCSDGVERIPLPS